MKFLLTYLTDEMSFASLPASTVDGIVARKVKVGQELLAQGKHVLGYRLWPTATATRLTRKDGEYVAVDGPFAETKEVVAGFALMRVGSRAEALELAARAPHAQWGTVEVREVHRPAH